MPVAIPALIGAASTVYGAHEAQKQEEKNRGLMGQGQNLYAGVHSAGNQLLGQGQQGIGSGLNYYTGMLTDPRAATAPEQNRISSMFAGQANNVRNMYPRGGFGPSAAMNLRNQEMGARENVVQQGRPMAAQALTGLGTNAASMGLQAYGMGGGMLNNIMNAGLNANQQQYQQGQGLGSGLFNAYQAYQLGQAFNGPGQQGQGGGGGGFYGGMGGYNPGYNPSVDSWQGFPPPGSTSQPGTGGT